MSHSFALYFIGGLNELTVLQRVDIFVHFKFDKISLGYFPHYLYIQMPSQNSLFQIVRQYL